MKHQWVVQTLADLRNTVPHWDLRRHFGDLFV